MHPILASVPILSVLPVFSRYRAESQARQAGRRQGPQRRLHERVAYMLWVLADAVEGPEPDDAPAPADAGPSSPD
jgi:hypothetical protein